MSDLISRQAAIDAECEVCQIAPKKERGHNCIYYVNGCKEIECLRALSPAPPERKKGKWIPHNEKCREYIGTVLISVRYDYWLCDTCGYRVKNGQPSYNFCPNCGADMRGEKDG